MDFDMMVGGMSWAQSAQLAQDLQGAGFSGMLFTETGTTPWMSIAAAAMAAEQSRRPPHVRPPRSPQALFSSGLDWSPHTNRRNSLGKQRNP